MVNLKEHYDNLAIQFDKCWHFSDEYLEANKTQIFDLLELKKEDIFIDLGCGSGLYSKLIHNEIQFINKITCVDFSEKMIEQINGLDCIKYQENIVEFSNRKIICNKILCKEVIHHLDNKNRKILFNNLYNNLIDNGKLLILYFTKQTNLPLFKNATIEYSKNVVEPDIIVSELIDSNFKVQTFKYKLPIKIDKQQYYNNLRKRFISVLEQFTDEEIESGIIELETKYNTINQFVISDNMISILAKK